MGVTSSRVATGLAACLAAGLLLASSALATSSGLVKHCGGKAVAAHSGISLVGSHVQVTSTAYNAYKVKLYPAHPELDCSKALQVVNAYLAAKLNRPENTCAARALAGKGCVVGKWSCVNKRQTPGHPGSDQQECLRTEFDRHGVVSRFTDITFRETDYDHS
jgi:hypothetical protein